MDDSDISSGQYRPSPLSSQVGHDDVGILVSLRSDSDGPSFGPSSSPPAPVATVHPESLHSAEVADENGEWNNGPPIHRAADGGPIATSSTPMDGVELPPSYKDIHNDQAS